jgi:hypothetical protein
MRPKSRPTSVTQNRISAVGQEGRRHLGVAARLAAWAVARDLRVDATRLTVAQSDAIADAALAAGLDRLAFWEAGCVVRRRWDWRRWPWSRSDR